MIDELGNITLDRAADLYVPLSWFDDSGNEIDISNADIVLAVKNGFQITPDLNPDNPKGRLIHFTEAHAQSLGSNPKDYMILVTEGEDNTVLLRGTIKSVGWTL